MIKTLYVWKPKVKQLISVQGRYKAYQKNIYFNILCIFLISNLRHPVMLEVVKWWLRKCTLQWCVIESGEICGRSRANLNNSFTVQAAFNYSLLDPYLYSLIFLPERCEKNCSWSLIVALFYKSTFLPRITDPVQNKSVKTDLAQFTHKIKVWSGKYWFV